MTKNQHKLATLITHRLIYAANTASFDLPQNKFKLNRQNSKFQLLNLFDSACSQLAKLLNFFKLSSSINQPKEARKMLILARRVGEKIKIDDDISIEILSVKGNQIRLGIDAPKHISVHRQEIYNKIQEEKERQQQEEKSHTQSDTVSTNAITGTEELGRE